jgi:hypothetical protein
MTSNERWLRIETSDALSRTRSRCGWESEWAIRPVDVVDAGTDHTSSARRETRRADPGRAVAAPQLWLDYRGRPWSPNAVGKAFTVLVRRFVRSAVGVEVSRMLWHTSEVFSQTRYRHLTDDAGNSPLPLYGMSA